MPRVDGIAKDDAESTKWLAQAAEQDDAYAQEFLGLRYLSGASVPREFDKAYFWLSLAARHPDPPDDTNALVRARDLRKALIAQRDKARATLTLEQRKAVEASLMTWRPTPEPDFGTSIHTPSERAAMQ
jgi:TPR repeat protein